MGLPAEGGGVGLEQKEQDEPQEGGVIGEGEEELYKCTTCLFVWDTKCVCLLGETDLCSKYRCVRITVHVTVASVLGGIVTSFLTTHLGPVKSVCSLPSSLLLSPSPHCPPSPASLLCPSPPSWSELVPWSPRVWAALPRVPCESTGGSEGLDPRPGRSWPERGRGGWLQGRRKMRREKRRGEERRKRGMGRGEEIR